MEIEAGVNGRRAVKGDDNKGIFDSSEDSVHRSLSPQITTEAGLPGACAPPPWRHAVVLSNGSTHTRGRHPKSLWFLEPWAGGTGKEGGPLFIFSAREVFVFRVSPLLPFRGWECLSPLLPTGS